MFSWNYSETIPTAASPDQIWALWQQPESWPSWDNELDWVRLEGPFETGTKGKMKPSSGPEVKFKLTEVTHLRSFTDTAQLPLTKMCFKHEYLPAKGTISAQIRHSVLMSGLLAPLFGKVIGKQIQVHLRSAMEKLSNQAIASDGVSDSSTSKAA